MTSRFRARAPRERAPSRVPAVRPMGRSPITYAVLSAAVSLAPAFGLALQRGGASAASAQTRQDSAAALLSRSEISVVEGGGITGRVHSVRLAAADGRVGVEYRPRETPATTPAFAGTLEPERYVALWRQLETARVWDIRSPAPTRGADLVSVEVRVRLGESTHVVRWDEAGQQTPEMKELAEIARRLLAVGREVAFAR
jgi:hypothetical protein